jgi:hypothetical protein
MPVSPAPSPAPDARAEEIFARTRAAFVARTYPRQLAYRVRVTGYQGTAATVRTYVTYERWPAVNVHARTISEEETANPVAPKGTNFSVPFISDVAGNGDTMKDVVGTPLLAVTYAFGLAPRPLDPPLPGDVATPGPDAPREIGAVTAVKRNYDVRLAGEETVAGLRCWHLTLKPLGNPGTYRVRDLYVAESNDQTVRLRTDGNFTAKATGSGLWTVNYVQTGDTWYLSDETSEGAVSSDAGTFDKMEVRFLDVRADPNENLDFGVPPDPDATLLVEP